MTAPLSDVEVLVMAGGEGRRLGALTTRIPKPMLPVNGRPLLQHILEDLRDQGARHVYVSVRHLSRVIADYFGDGQWLGVDIDYVVERRPLDTAGALGLLPSLSKPLLVVNGDVLTHVPVGPMASHHSSSAAAMTIGCAEQRIQVPYGVVEGGRPAVTAVHEKPELLLRVIAGVYLVSPDVVAEAPADRPLAMPQLISTLLEQRRCVVGFDLPGPWLDIGSPESYALADQIADATTGGPRTEPPSILTVPGQVDAWPMDRARTGVMAL